MPPSPAAPRERRMAAAEARWQAVLDARPDLEPAVALQRQLIGLVVDLADAVEHAPLPRLTLPPRYVAAKLARGTPALAAEPIPLPVPVMAPALVAMCDALAAGGAGDAALGVRTALVEARVDPGSLLTASLQRDQHAIRSGAVQRGLSPDLVWLVAELAVSPYVYVLQRRLLAPAGDAALAAALAGWTPGYCPACGSWPALAEIHAAHRVLRCSFCARGWELKTFACVYCGEGGDRRFVTFAGSPERPDRRVEICGACGGYLKTIDVAELSPFPLIAIGDLETMELDLLAMEKGYRRPALKEFKRR